MCPKQALLLPCHVGSHPDDLLQSSMMDSDAEAATFADVEASDSATQEQPVLAPQAGMSWQTG